MLICIMWHESMIFILIDLKCESLGGQNKKIIRKSQWKLLRKILMCCFDVWSKVRIMGDYIYTHIRNVNCSVFEMFCTRLLGALWKIFSRID